MEKREFNKLRYICISGIVIFGSGSSIIQKGWYINGIYFPLFQVLLMFIGELLSIIFLVYGYLSKSKSTKPNICVSTDSSLLALEPKRTFKKRLSQYTYSILAIFDFASALIGDYCLNFLNPSDYLSLTMLVSYYVLFYRIFVQKRKPYKHQWFGLIIFTIGMLLVILNNTLMGERKRTQENLFYIALLILTELFQAFQYILTEHFIVKKDLSSSEINTLKGFTGILLCVISYYPLSKIFTYDYMNLISPLKRLGTDSSFSFLAFLLLFDLCLYNYFYIRMIKLTEPFAACTADSARIIIVGVIFAFAYNTGVIYLQIIGGFLICIGLVIYNEMIIIPFFGLKKSAKLSLAENKTIRKQKEESMRWIHNLDQLVEIQNKKRSKIIPKN